jgi:hypothetical protein
VTRRSATWQRGGLRALGLGLRRSAVWQRGGLRALGLGLRGSAVWQLGGLLALGLGLRRSAVWQLGGLVALGLGLRVWVLIAAGRLSADEAIPGLMARHILLAAERPVFYWGQAYFGALEAYFVAAFFALLGFHPWLVFAPPLLASLMLIPLTWLLGQNLGPTPAGLIAALPLAVTPPVQARLLVNAGGGFALGAALELTAILLIMRALRAACPSLWTLALAALVGGVAAWVWQPALVTLPLLLIVPIVSIPRFRSPRGLACVGLVLVGLLPMLIYNLGADWPTLVALTRAFDQQSLPASGLLAHGQQFVTTLLTALGGGDENFGGANPAQAALLAIALVLGPLVIVGIGIRSCPPSLQARQRAVCAAVLVAALAPALIAAHGGARYLVEVFVAACALCGALLALLVQRAPRAGQVSAVLFALACVVPNLTGYAHITTLMAPDQLSRLDQTYAAVDALEQRGLTQGYTDYWAAYTITFISGEQIIAAPSIAFLYSGRLDRFPVYTASVDGVQTPRDLFLLVDQRCSAQAYLGALQASGAMYRTESVARWLLVWDIQPPGSAEAMTLASLRASLAAQQSCVPVSPPD